MGCTYFTALLHWRERWREQCGDESVIQTTRAGTGAYPLSLFRSSRRKAPAEFVAGVPGRFAQMLDRQSSLLSHVPDQLSGLGRLGLAV